MKKIFLLFFLIAFPASADTNISGTISSDTTWSPAGGVYIIDSSFSVASSTTLTIEPGTIIKARVNSQGGPSILGHLIARGTSELPVYFTSIYDDSVGGDTGDDGPNVGTNGQWQGLYFKNGSMGELNHVVVRYSGYGGYGFGNFVGIENDGGMLDIKNSNIYDNYSTLFDWGSGYYRAGFGVRNKAGNLSITDSIVKNHSSGVMGESGTISISRTQILDNTNIGLHIVGLDSLTLFSNNFSGNQKTAYVSAEINFIHEGNTSTDLSYRGFDTTGSVRDGTIWHSRDLPILITQGEVTVLSGDTLTIEPGTIVKLGNPYRYGAIVVHGNLISRGTSDNKIYFTSTRDDTAGGDTNADGGDSLPAPRDWVAIFLESGSSAVFEHSVVRYSGFNFNGEYLPGVAAAIYNRGSDLSIRDSFIGHNFGASIFQDAGTTTINQSELTDESYGLQSRGGTIKISQSSLHSHIDQAIYNQSVQIIDARNNWWGDSSGPRDISTSTPTGTGDRVSANVLFDPWLGSDPLIAPPRNPVIIVPGIMGSYLERTDLVLDNERWPNLLLMFLSPDDLYLNDLELTPEGNTIRDISATNILTSIRSHNFFEGLSDQLSETQDVKSFPYDWRLDLGVSVLALKDKIDKIKSENDIIKVNLVAHSMGGLLVKEYLRRFGGDSINKFIDIGTPHLGSPKSFKILNYGDNFGFEKFGLDVLNPERTKIISQNMPSVYELLPSSSYGNYVYDLDDLDNNGVRGSLSYTDTKQFMKNTGRNSALVDRADAFHQNIDNLDPSDYGIETYNIVGCGVQTLGKIFVLNKETSGDVEYNISYINGDGTVPLKSAESIPALKTYYAKNAVHATMPSTSGIKELIADILMATSTNNLDISLYPNLVESSNGCTIPNGKIVSFHSPIELHIYSGGNHVGPNADGDIEINIPGVSYEVIEGNKFAFLPDGVEYTITGSATDIGTFNARVETIENEITVETRYFNQVPIASTTQVELTNSSILIDNNSDGIFESEFPVSSILDENQSSDLTKPITSVTVIGKRKRVEPYTAPVKVTLVAIDDNSGVLKTEYSVDGGQNWTLYNKPFTVRTKGRTHLLYRSTDRAGNVELPEFIDIDIFKKVK